MKRSQSRTDAGNGRVVASGVSRRELIAAGGAMAAAATSSPLIANTASAQGSAGADATLDRLRRAAGDSGRRILIRGGTVISMDAGVGDFAAGDVLIEGKRISAVGPDLAGAGQGGNAIVESGKPAPESTKATPPFTTADAARQPLLQPPRSRVWWCSLGVLPSFYFKRIENPES